MGNVNTDSIRDIWHGPGFRFYREKHLAGRGKDISLCSGCPDWKYRSWDHNYWTVVRNAEASRKSKLGEHDDFLGAVENAPPA
jgi:hypothetical protein